MKDSKHFNINDIDINKIRVSKANLFVKEKKSYKHYILYEDDDKYSNICFNKTLAGYFNEYANEDGKYAGNVSKTMTFVINDDADLLEIIVNIFEYLGNKLEIDLHEYFNEGSVDIYLKAKVYKRTCFNKKGCKDIHVAPNKKK